MSASSKKKLRNEQAAEKMTQRQQAEQKEAKKLKIQTIVFSVVVIAMLIVAVVSIGYNAISNSSILAKNTTAVTLGEHELSNAELNYYYVDAVYSFYNSYSSYISYFLDTTAPLDQQTYDYETGDTWADYFTDAAMNNAASTYAMADAANAAGFTLSEDVIASIDANMETLAAYAAYYGYTDTEDYLKAMYGNAATLETYREYTELNNLADAYYNHYSEELSYTDDDLRAAEAENFNTYSSFSYNSYYISASKYLTGGTTDEEGNTTYTDDEKNASIAAAEEAANSLIGDDIASVEDLDTAIGALSINAESETAVTSTAYTDTLYSSVNTTIQEWVTDASRTAGDKAVIPYTTHSHADGETHSDDEDSSAYDVVNGYYVVYFVGSNDNTYSLANVRHILIQPEGGTYNSSTGLYDYTDEELATAKAEAEALLEEWKSGKASEETFASLANEHSADGDGTTGGLYENVYPGQMVTNFNDWCFDETRAAGDTGIVESPYGYHIMYYVGDSETSYRDYMIENALRSADLQEWYTSVVSTVTITEGNTSYLSTDMILGSSY